VSPRQKKSTANASSQPASAPRARSQNQEAGRIAEADERRALWRAWGPYLAERQWGTVREDYSANGDAWSYFPHDQARSRAYRWGEDGLGGISDTEGRFAFAFAFWNGVDPILKERIFGLSGHEGNHGEDAKELWWFEDSTPTHSWMRWSYCYPTSPFPYDDLVQENARRSRLDPEYELVDTGVLDGRRFVLVTVEYAKAAPFDLVMRLTATNFGPEPMELHVLPTLWFPNTWSWGDGRPRPELVARPGRIEARSAELGQLVLTGDGEPAGLACENETNRARLFGVENETPYPKDGIGDHIIAGASTVAPDGRGTKGSLWYRWSLAPGGSAEALLRLADAERPDQSASEQRALLRKAKREADAFYKAVIGRQVPSAVAEVARSAIAGLLWSKQWYHYDVERWLAGDPAGPPPPPERKRGRNHRWRHVDCRDVISMPDTWEYPWFAAWDLAFHAVAMAEVDPAFAKRQLLLLTREWYQHPSGQLPAYEWNFSDVNPPLHAWAALRVFERDGASDFDFLERVFTKLLLEFTWWVNRKDSKGTNLFEGGFLGLDNIGPFDRSALPAGLGTLEQSDGTGWMAMYCLQMLEIALHLALADRVYEDLATKFVEHFATIATAASAHGLWDETDGFFYDQLDLGDGRRVPLRVRSMVGLVPLCAVASLDDAHLDRLGDFARRLEWFSTHKPHLAKALDFAGTAEGGHRLLSLVNPDQLVRILARLLDEGEFLSPHGLRSVSAVHRDHPFRLELDGVSATVDYEPAESTTNLFGGNSNWRGPVWFPLNFLLIESLRRFHRFLGDSLVVELPTGQGKSASLGEVADELSRRLVSLFLADASGHRPYHGRRSIYAEEPELARRLLFHEYFDGDDGTGLGASHQTGWTALVAPIARELGGRWPQAGS